MLRSSETVRAWMLSVLKERWTSREFSDERRWIPALLPRQKPELGYGLLALVQTAPSNTDQLLLRKRVGLLREHREQKVGLVFDRNA